MTHQHNVTLVFGTAATSSYVENGGKITEEVKDGGNVETFTFKTRDELNAFMNGVAEAIGWMEYAVHHDSRDESDAA